MKIKEGFMLKNVAGKNIVVPVGEEAVNFNGLITLNSSGKMLFEALQKDVEMIQLVQLMLVKYDIDEETAKNDVNAFVNKLKSKGII
ncbi:MAG: PqqD family protein [Firmicutes bacterium]|nr:PqqD family protein [Bacillota bacterium]